MAAVQPVSGSRVDDRGDDPVRASDLVPRREKRERPNHHNQGVVGFTVITRDSDISGFVRQSISNMSGISFRCSISSICTFLLVQVPCTAFATRCAFAGRYIKCTGSIARDHFGLGCNEKHVIVIEEGRTDLKSVVATSRERTEVAIRFSFKNPQTDDAYH